MIALIIATEAATVAEALTHLRTIAAAVEDFNSTRRRGGAVILDGIARPVTRGTTTLGSITGQGNTADKLTHYTGEDHRP